MKNPNNKKDWRLTTLLKKITVIYSLSMCTLFNAQTHETIDNMFNTTIPSQNEMDTVLPQIVCHLNQIDSSFMYVKITKVSLFEKCFPLYLSERFDISDKTNSYPDTFFNINSKIIRFYYRMPQPKRGLEYLHQYDSIWSSLRWFDTEGKNENADYYLDEIPYDFYLDNDKQPFKINGFYFYGDSLYTIGDYMLLFYLKACHQLYINRYPINKVIMHEVRYRSRID